MRLFALALVAGVLVLQNQRSLPEAPFALVAGAMALACLLVPRERPLVRALLVLACGAAAGFGYAAWRAELRLAESLPVSLEGRDLVVTGIVSGLPQERDESTRFLFDVESPAARAWPSTLSLAWYAEGDTPPRVVPCERWRLTVRLKRPRGLANRHAFDFEAWALERGIRATGYVRNVAGAQRLAERVEGWPCMLHRWRGAVRDRMLAHLGDAPRRGVLEIGRASCRERVLYRV